MKENGVNKTKPTTMKKEFKAAVRCCTATKKTKKMRAWQSKEKPAPNSRGKQRAPASKDPQREKQMTSGRNWPTG